MKSKTIKISIAVILIVIVAVGAYLVSSIILFQRVINEGSVLADEQCLKVNPIIIRQKNHYINSLQGAIDEDGEKYIAETDLYFTESENYIREQTAWLEAEKAHMNRWDFKYFVPSYMQEAAQLQYDMRDAENEYTKLMLQAYG